MIPHLPKGDFRFIALDVETANGDSASICQIGLAFVHHGGAIDTWASFVDPLMPFAPFNTELHGIGAGTVRNAPNFAEVFTVLRDTLAAHPLVQHSRFDEKAMAAACRIHKLPKPNFQWIDSVAVARRAWPELKGNGGHGLASLKERLGLSFKHHDAGEDARAAAEVILHAEAVFSAKGGAIRPAIPAFQLKLPL
ncbi:3'-5' exonuclease [Alphaproteobacteria bacterium KMM 3653]|uniref:3'-5' exonuclease n=2 Tax=Harenicola maris TaxID=2841044 RepID=A0AAP2CT96_9RHOB|nr:3'-5' exonuclease [Harenicola maris]